MELILVEAKIGIRSKILIKNGVTIWNSENRSIFAPCKKCRTYVIFDLIIVAGIILARRDRMAFLSIEINQLYIKICDPDSPRLIRIFFV